MAKTVFSALMQIPSTWLNKVFNHRHDGQDQDGSAPLDYATDSGAANAYTIALTPALTLYIPGLPIIFKASNANTGPSTLNVNGLGVKTIKKRGSLDLESGDLRAGQIVTVVYDGTYFQLIGRDEFPSGTKMVFFQTSAPTGWTKDTTHNDKALRVVSGNGGGTGGSRVLSSANTGSHTLTVPEIPAHAHTYNATVQGQPTWYVGASGTYIGEQAGQTASTGGGVGHDHPLDLAYVDVIICTKN